MAGFAKILRCAPFPRHSSIVLVRGDDFDERERTMSFPRLSRIAGLLLLASAGAVSARAQTLFGSDVVDDKLVRLVPATLNGTVVGPFGPSGGTFAMTGLAYDGVGGVLYGIGTNSGASSIYTINPATGQSTVLTAISTGGNPNGLAFDPANNFLYITDNNSNALYRYNLAAPQLTLIGTISGGFSSVEGLGYDALTCTLFGVADDQDQIIKINTGTAASVALPNSLVAGNWRGLDFDPVTGLLFATRVNASAILTSIDPLTGIGTDLGSISGAGTFSFMQGLAAVPEPSTSAALAGLAALSIVALRRFCSR